ncbi:hypothetical protein PoB_004967400 [Plakobranchus ocellatus]|uniref:PH domain-containing protein n=1 Tax=Plakobranchus ocellatus TaxID=259542 RepID=A0AAV4BWJ1_9GAST|nr:hypothetical protein PoB_004967400 [Plakobranchus ocellatus]
MLMLKSFELCNSSTGLIVPGNPNPPPHKARFLVFNKKASTELERRRWHSGLRPVLQGPFCCGLEPRHQRPGLMEDLKA